MADTEVPFFPVDELLLDGERWLLGTDLAAWLEGSAAYREANPDSVPVGEEIAGDLATSSVVRAYRQGRIDMLRVLSDRLKHTDG